MQLFKHALQLATGLHLKLQAGTPADQLQHIKAQASQLPLAIGKTQGQQMLIHPYPDDRVGVQPALLSISQLQGLGLVRRASNRAPALLDTQVLTLAQAGQGGIHQAR
ncbi:hypothetical protein D3C76_1425100 [compost metagenome]